MPLLIQRLNQDECVVVITNGLHKQSWLVESIIQYADPYSLVRSHRASRGLAAALSLYMRSLQYDIWTWNRERADRLWKPGEPIQMQMDLCMGCAIITGKMSDPKMDAWLFSDRECMICSAVDLCQSCMKSASQLGVARDWMEENSWTAEEKRTDDICIMCWTAYVDHTILGPEEHSPASEDHPCGGSKSSDYDPGKAMQLYVSPGQVTVSEVLIMQLSSHAGNLLDYLTGRGHWSGHRPRRETM